MLYKLGLNITGFWLSFGCSTTLSQRIWESTLLRCHNVNLQRCHTKLRCHNVVTTSNCLLSIPPPHTPAVTVQWFVCLSVSMRTSQWNGLNLESCPILTVVGFLLIKVKGMLFSKFFFKFSFWKFFCNETLVHET